jgi:transcription antitermination factor NusG
MAATKAKFFVLACEPGKEHRVRREFLKRAAVEDLKPKFVKRAFAATHREQRTRPDGKPIIVNAKSYPGYLIVEMVYDGAEYKILDLLKGLYHCWGFLPFRPPIPKIRNPEKLSPTEEDAMYDYQSWRPTALDTEEEALVLLRRKEKNTAKPKPECGYDIGTKLQVCSGQSAFNNFVGVCTHLILSDKEVHVTIAVEVLGKTISVTMPFQYLKPAKD